MPATNIQYPFLADSTDLLELRHGRVFLLPKGWRKYSEIFKAAGKSLQDGAPVSEFHQVLQIACDINAEQLYAKLNDLQTPIADKQFIRAMLTPSVAPSSTTAQVLDFPKRKKETT